MASQKATSTLQLVSVALARADGIQPERIIVGAFPAWLGDERSAASRILAEVVVRRALYPAQQLRFDEPDGDTRGSTAWPFVVAAALGASGPDGIVMRRPGGDPRRMAAETRAAAAVAMELAAGNGATALVYNMHASVTGTLALTSDDVARALGVPESFFAMRTALSSFPGQRPPRWRGWGWSASSRKRRHGNGSARENSD